MLRRASSRSDTAEVGVGTLIVFIAMVLVAAVAAAVIINTAGSLQQRAQTTGMEATSEVSSNIRVVSMHGVRNSSTADIYDVRLQVQLAAGGQNVDLNRMILRFSDGAKLRTYNHSHAPLPDGGQGGTPQTWFNTTWLRGDGANFVMKSGDLVDLHFNLYDTSLPTRKAIQLQLIPDVGASVPADFRTPSTYASDISVKLR